MRRENIRLIDFVFMFCFIFLLSILFYFVGGFTGFDITGFAILSDVDVGFEIDDGTNGSVDDLVNDSSGSSDSVVVFTNEVQDGGGEVELDNLVNARGVDDDDGSGGSDIDFVLWGLIIGGIVISILIVLIVVLMISGGKKKGSASSSVVKKSVASGSASKKSAVSDKKVLASNVAKKIEAKKVVSNVALKKSAVSAKNVDVKEVGVPEIQERAKLAVSKVSVDSSSSAGKNMLVDNKSTVVSAVVATKVVSGAGSSTKLASTVPSLEFIKNYSFSFSKDPKERIRYFLNNGNQFVNKKNFVGARQLYSWINEEYKNLKRHDDLLYREILDFNRSLG